MIRRAQARTPSQSVGSIRSFRGDVCGAFRSTTGGIRHYPARPVPPGSATDRAGAVTQPAIVQYALLKACAPGATTGSGRLSGRRKGMTWEYTGPIGATADAEVGPRSC